jgi:hypothetical protein
MNERVWFFDGEKLKKLAEHFGKSVEAAQK